MISKKRKLWWLKDAVNICKRLVIYSEHRIKVNAEAMKRTDKLKFSAYQKTKKELNGAKTRWLNYRRTMIRFHKSQLKKGLEWGKMASLMLKGYQNSTNFSFQRQEKINWLNLQLNDTNSHITSIRSELSMMRRYNPRRIKSSKVYRQEESRLKEYRKEKLIITAILNDFKSQSAA